MHTWNSRLGIEAVLTGDTEVVEGFADIVAGKLVAVPPVECHRCPYREMLYHWCTLLFCHRRNPVAATGIADTAPVEADNVDAGQHPAETGTWTGTPIEKGTLGVGAGVTDAIRHTVALVLERTPLYNPVLLVVVVESQRKIDRHHVHHHHVLVLVLFVLHALVQSHSVRHDKSHHDKSHRHAPFLLDWEANDWYEKSHLTRTPTLKNWVILPSDYCTHFNVTFPFATTAAPHGRVRAHATSLQARTPTDCQSRGLFLVEFRCDRSISTLATAPYLSVYVVGKYSDVACVISSRFWDCGKCSRT